MFCVVNLLAIILALYAKACWSCPLSLKTFPKLEYASASSGFFLMASALNWADLDRWATTTISTTKPVIKMQDSNMCVQ